MKHFILAISIVIQVFYASAGDPVCSCHSAFDLLKEPTHVQDSGLLMYDVSHYGLWLEVNDTSTFIKGHTDILARANQDINELVFELSNSLQVDSVFLDGSLIPLYEHVDNLIEFSSGREIKRTDLFRVSVYYQGYGGRNSFFAGISNRMDVLWGNRVTYTLSEPFQSADWFACKQVLTDKADSADIYITVGDSLMAGSNGILARIDTLAGNKLRYHWVSRYPIAYYLLSLCVSKYRDYSFYTGLGTGDSLLVQNFIYDTPGYLEENRDDIDKTAGMLQLYSRLFTTYPFLEEKYGHCVAPMGGGMEHQTMTTLSGFNFTLVAHELVHQWFGDNVTCANWRDIWVNEGFASYGEYIALEELSSREAADSWMRNAHEWALSEPEGSVYIPEEDARDEFRIFSRALSYKKGAALLHMIRYELDNDSLFYETLSRFQQRFADSVATGADFEDVLSETSGSDFGWFFDQWYYGQGFPRFTFTWWFTGDSAVIDIEQSGSSARTGFFRTKLDLALKLEGGGDTTVRILIERPELRIGIPVSIPVIDLVPDPDNHVLEKSNIIRRSVSNGYMTVNPNPFGDKLNIVFQSGIASREIVLTDLNGKILEKHVSTSERFTLDTATLAQGLYLLQVTDGRDSYSTKVIRQ
jgi:aminopeptidase N